MTLAALDLIDSPPKGGAARDNKVRERHAATRDRDGRTSKGNSAGRRQNPKTDEVKVGPIRVGLRMPYALLLIAITEWIDPAESAKPDGYSPMCERWVEEALLARASDSDGRATAWAAGELPAERPRPSVRQGYNDFRQIAVKLTPEAYSIAQKLGLSNPKNYSVSFVCEWLLAEELRNRGVDALKRISRVAAQITNAMNQDEAAEAGQPPGKE